MPCSHSTKNVTVLEDKFWECKVRCDECGVVVTEKGWGLRGVGKSFGDGIFSFFRGEIAGEVFKGPPDPSG